MELLFVTPVSTPKKVQLNTNALPLALLLVRPSGAARARDFVARALRLWEREKSRARITHALARYV